jgi:hypothetical protein
MTQPVPMEPGDLGAQDNNPYGYLHVVGLTFARPLYMRMLAILLVLLVAAAAAYAAFMRPVHELVVNSGALVLGVWGVRSILTPQNLYYVTALDVSLSVVIILLLGAISVRALLFVHERGELHLLERVRRVAGGKDCPFTRVWRPPATMESSFCNGSIRVILKDDTAGTFHPKNAKR